MFELIVKEVFIPTVMDIFSEDINDLSMSQIYQYFSSKVFTKNHEINILYTSYLHINDQWELLYTFI